MTEPSSTTFAINTNLSSSSSYPSTSSTPPIPTIPPSSRPTKARAPSNLQPNLIRSHSQSAVREQRPAVGKQASSTAVSSLRPTLLYSLSAEARASRESLRSSASSTSRASSANRSSSAARSGFLSFAALARDKTSNALAGLSSRSQQSSPPTSSSLRSYPSTSTLARTQSSLSFSGSETTLRPSNTTYDAPGGDYFEPVSSSASTSQEYWSPPPTITRAEPTGINSRHRPDEADAATPFDFPTTTAPVLEPSTSTYGAINKMHQTSSRLLRMTPGEERPFTRDFQDLFSTLMVSLPLTPHRVRFQRVDHTFSSEEAINNLGSLKFSQSNRMPDPKDPSRIVTTTTTTTFSMAREMARSVCQRFMDARFIESADGKMVSTFPLKNGVWQLTPKGMHVLQRFCQRNGINQRHVVDLLESPRNSMQLVILERDVRTDKLSHDKATIEVIFRRFVGQDGPNVKQSTSSADSDSLSDYGNGLVGVKMAKERKIADKTVFNTFTGKATVEWLTDCCCTVDRQETCEIAAEFVQQGLVKAVLEDKLYIQHNPQERDFQPTKAAIYTLTDKGQRVAGWILRSRSNGSEGNNGVRADPRVPSTRDSNTNRLTVILSDPALRLLFREFLRDTHCEENLAFYLDVVEFTSTYRSISRKNVTPEISTIRESLAAAYGLYNAFLAPGSPCELNIDHNLRNNLAGRMTRAVGDDEAMINSLKDVAKLFDEAQNSVFKLMSSDSVPKFLKDPKYAAVLREHDFDAAIAAEGTSNGKKAEWAPAVPAAAVTKLSK